MTVTNNDLIKVETYNIDNLAVLSNKACLTMLANKEYKEFNKDISASLGAIMNIWVPPRFSSVNSTTWSIQGVTQRLQPLQVDQQVSVSFELSDEQRILFNSKSIVEETEMAFYKRQYGGPIMETIIARYESSLAQNFISHVEVYDQYNQVVGVNKNTGPYRFYGNGSTPINSPLQLAQMAANYRAFGTTSDLVCVIPMTDEPAIIQNMLNQFVTDRNEEVAEEFTIGTYRPSNVTYYRSNMLSEHVSGMVATLGQVLTVVSTNDPTGQNVTQITFSGASNNQIGAINAGDLLEFNPSSTPSNFPKFLTFNGDIKTKLPLQLRAYNDANSNGSGLVVVDLAVPIAWNGVTQGNILKINTPIIAGQTAYVAKSHTAGCLFDKKALFLANPALPSYTPFTYDSRYDEDTKTSLRMAYGTLLGNGILRVGVDSIFGSTLSQDYCTRFLFPLVN